LPTAPVAPTMPTVSGEADMERLVTDAAALEAKGRQEMIGELVAVGVREAIERELMAGAKP